MTATTDLPMMCVSFWGRLRLHGAFITPSRQDAMLELAGRLHLVMGISQVVTSSDRGGRYRWIGLCLTGAAEDDRAPTEERACIWSRCFCSSNRSPLAEYMNALLSERGRPRPPPSNRTLSTDTRTLFRRQPDLNLIWVGCVTTS